MDDRLETAYEAKFSVLDMDVVRKAQGASKATGPINEAEQKRQAELMKQASMAVQSALGEQASATDVYKRQVLRRTVSEPTRELKEFCLFLDDEGVLKVGGCLRLANLPTEMKHPMLLQHGDEITLPAKLTALLDSHRKKRCEGRDQMTTAGLFAYVAVDFAYPDQELKSPPRVCVLPICFCFALNKQCEQSTEF
ncbi:hypothetical protein T4E_10776 [Trichinella pseudospiralis]|uniref:Uncharacterized protein n=1 Tax=Trichinella pseudospiralis TaxID=6337 RepID=A0A0V0Y3E1_TRIPS|nr:hypothetical protein T4E_10776 [Trichinella pseudospiralis]